MNIFSSRFIQLLLAVSLGNLMISSSVSAASLSWSADGNKERVTIITHPNEGLVQKYNRIDPKALLVTYTEVPAGLIQPQGPAAAKIFAGTEQLGRALAFHTKTAEFGYTILRNTQTVFIIEFYPDPAGASWKSPHPRKTASPKSAEPAPQAHESANQQTTTHPTTTVASNQTVSIHSETTQQPAFHDGKFDTEQRNAPLPAITATAATRGSASNASTEPVPQFPFMNQNANRSDTVLGVASVPIHAPDQKNPLAPEHRNPLPAPNLTVNTSPQSAEVRTKEVTAPEELPVGKAVRVSNGPRYRGKASRTPVPDLMKQVTAQQNTLPESVNALPVPANQTQEVATTTSVQSASATNASQHSAPKSSATSQPSAPVADTQPTAKPHDGIMPRVNGTRKSSTTSTPAPAAGIVQKNASTQAQPDTPQTIPAEQQKNTSSPAASQHTAPSTQATPASAKTTHTEQATSSASSSNTHAAPTAGHNPTAPSASAPHETGNATATSSNGTAVIYVDEQGNPLPPPLNPEETLVSIEQDLNAKKIEPALTNAETLLAQNNLTTEQREAALHYRAQALFEKAQDDFSSSFQTISDATNLAINFNRKSLRNANALLRLGYMNLKMKNVPEAEAFFNVLKRQFPDDEENVPLTYYYWGKYYFDNNNLQQAADQFQYLIQVYPNSKYTRETALSLAKTLYLMGYYQKAYEVVEYIEKRWSRFYLDYPPFLATMGDIAFRLNNYPYALKQYWLYTNLTPQNDDSDLVLARIGDIYMMQRMPEIATLIYKECRTRFPDKDGGLIALMRLAESAIYDNPNLGEMFDIFKRPFENSPAEAYQQIISKFPQSTVAPLAELKLAMWYLWKHEYIKCLDLCTEFANKYPKHELLPKVKEVAMKAFSTMTTESVEQNRQQRMLAVWEHYPIIQQQENILTPDSRVALAVSYWENNKPNESIATLEPFLLGNMIPEYSEMALNLLLTIYLDYENWDAIETVAETVALWNLSDKSQQALDYAVALAAENKGNSEKAAPFWAKLHQQGDLSPAQTAYVTFFMAQEAEKHGDLDKAYQLGVDALQRLNALTEVTPNAADSGKLLAQLRSLMRITEQSGQLEMSLQYSQQYLQRLDANDLERSAILYNIARLYKRQGNETAWKKTLSDIVTQYPNSIHGQSAASELSSKKIMDSAAQYSPTGQL